MAEGDMNRVTRWFGRGLGVVLIALTLSEGWPFITMVWNSRVNGYMRYRVADTEFCVDRAYESGWAKYGRLDFGGFGVSACLSKTGGIHREMTPTNGDSSCTYEQFKVFFHVRDAKDGYIRGHLNLYLDLEAKDNGSGSPLEKIVYQDDSITAYKIHDNVIVVEYDKEIDEKFSICRGFFIDDFVGIHTPNGSYCNYLSSVELSELGHDERTIDIEMIFRWFDKNTLENLDDIAEEKIESWTTACQ